MGRLLNSRYGCRRVGDSASEEIGEVRLLIEVVGLGQYRPDGVAVEPSVVIGLDGPVHEPRPEPFVLLAWFQYRRISTVRSSPNRAK